MSFDFRVSPPYEIGVQHIEEVYQSEALQGEIQHKFELTLGLDERYRLIALCIALASIEKRAERALIEGFDVNWVREQALSWWPNGFAMDASYELFRTILDEMIGLGILRRAGQERYALRSPNVLNLLGSKAHIEHKIIDVARLPTPPTYEAASFHRSLNNDCWIRSPLTAEQEACVIEPINGTVIVYGSQLSGLDNIRSALGAIPSQGTVHFADAISQLGQFTKWLREVDVNRSEGVTLAVVTPESHWSLSWVRASAEFLRPKVSSKKRFLRTVFVADPVTAWEFSENVANVQLVVTELSIKPWQEAALRRWLEDAEFGPEAVGNCKQILELTGGWGMLINAMGKACRGSPHNWRVQVEALRTNWVSESASRDCSGLSESVLSVLEVMAKLDSPVSTEDIAAFAPTSDVPRVLRWADRLAFARETEPDRWVLDAMVRSVIVAKG